MKEKIVLELKLVSMKDRLKIFVEVVQRIEINIEK
jgi:hypothetical protein